MKKGKTHQGGAKYRSADAHSHTSFSGCGGTSDPTNGVGPKAGIGGGGGATHHSAAKSKANIKPPNAHAHTGMSPKGVKSTNEY